MLQITLRAARVNVGLTQSDAAKLCRVSLQTLNKWEKGHVIPDYASLRLLSDVYKIPMENISLPEKSTKVEMKTKY